MMVGIVGAPNKGKSTIFSALTMNEVAIADYPFTTIDPNLGVAYATKPCVHTEFGVKCKARNSMCVNDTRLLPINVVDVAGLVEGAHEGRGMGNKFLNDLAAADALIIVSDASGQTDPSGNKGGVSDPVQEIEMVKSEIIKWIASVVSKHSGPISRRDDGAQALLEVLAGMKVSREDIERAASEANLLLNRPNWSEDSIMRFSSHLFEISKPFIVAANKSDVKGPRTNNNIAALTERYGAKRVLPCSGAIELALRKAAKQGIIDYQPGSHSFKALRNDISSERQDALEYMGKFLSEHGTNVQELINDVVFSLLDNIVVYPVEDESKYSDHFGNVLPDAILMRRGSTALQLAEKIHTDIAKGMLYAVDVRTKKRLAKDYVLQDNDVLKIVSTAK